MFKRLSILLLALTLLACSDANKSEVKTTLPASGATYVEGTHYTVLENPLPVSSGKIEVTEFFWYGCPHCEHFEPALAAWEKSKPDDVVLIRVPAVWSDQMVLHAKVFFLAQNLPEREAVHRALFREISALTGEKNLELHNERLARFLARYGVSASDYNAWIVSADSDARVRAALALFNQSRAGGTPAVIVNGKYLVNNKVVHSMEEIMVIADYLIAKERQAKP